MNVSKLVISSFVFQIVENASFTFGFVLTNQEALVWHPPYEQKNPIDPLPGQLLSTQEFGSSLFMPLPSA